MALIDRLAQVLDDPVFLPFQLDLENRRVLFVRLDSAARAAAPFLDQRALPAAPEGYWLPLDAVLEKSATPDGAQLDWIFHIGHCGSTLLSRLLQAWPALHVLREPLPLRIIAEAAVDEAANQTPHLMLRFVALWSRPLPPHSRSLVKATSSCNGLAAPMLAQLPQARAVLMDMPLPSYLATVLKSEASLADVLAAAPQRRRILAGDDPDALAALAALAPAQQCAMAWLAEQVRFSDLATGPDGERILRVDFEALLADPRQTLTAVATHLQLPLQPLGAAMASPWWGRYSKSDGHAYGRTDRQHDLALSRQRHGDATAAAEAWLEIYLRQRPDLAGRAGL